MNYLRAFFLFLQTVACAQVKNSYASVAPLMQVISEQQSQSSKGIATYIQNHFKGEEVQIKAAYFHVISTVSYDVTYNFSLEQLSSEDDSVAQTIASKKGVCIHYAKFFKAIVDQLGYSCQIISGYTKQNHQIGIRSHAWCAIKMNDGKWYVFDPTWDAGYVKDKKFFRNLVSKHFKMVPSQAITTHMPFDYLWQFAKEPLSNREFYNGKAYDDKPKRNYEFQVEIDKYLKLSDCDKAFESAARIQENEILNNLILEQYTYNKKVFTTIRQHNNIQKFNQLIEDYNSAIVLLNDFILYRNKEFLPSFSDAILLEMIQTPKETLESVQKNLFALGSIGAENAASLNVLKDSISDTTTQAIAQYDFVKEYLSKSKKERKKMFRKVTWLGIPIQ